MDSAVILDMKPRLVGAVHEFAGCGIVPAPEEVVAQALAQLEVDRGVQCFFEQFPSMEEITVRLASYLLDVVVAGSPTEGGLFLKCLRAGVDALVELRSSTCTVKAEFEQIPSFLFGLFKHVHEALACSVLASNGDTEVEWDPLDLPLSTWLSRTNAEFISVNRSDVYLDADVRRVACLCIVSKIISQHDLVAVGGTISWLAGSLSEA